MNTKLGKSKAARTNRFIATDMYRGLKCLAKNPNQEKIDRGEMLPFVLFPQFDRDKYIAAKA